MSKFATQLDCLEARDKWHVERIRELEAQVARWEWAKLILQGEDTPLANARTLELAAGLMRNEDIDTIVDNAIRALKESK